MPCFHHLVNSQLLAHIFFIQKSPLCQTHLVSVSSLFLVIISDPLNILNVVLSSTHYAFFLYLTLPFCFQHHQFHPSCNRYLTVISNLCISQSKERIEAEERLRKEREEKELEWVRLQREKHGQHPQHREMEMRLQQEKVCVESKMMGKEG